MDGSTFLSVEEAAVVMRISPVTVYKHIKEGKIPSKKIGSRLLIPNSFIQTGTSETKNASSAGTFASPFMQSDEQIRISTMRKSIEKHLQTLLASAPQNGKCTLELFMKDGCITTIALKTEALLEME